MLTLSQSTKRKIRVTKLITDQEVYFFIALKSMKKFCIIKFINILTINFSQANVNLKRDAALNIVFQF